MEGRQIGVIDLGTDVSPEQLVTPAQDYHAEIGALLTTTMVGMMGVVAALRFADLEGIKVDVGGPPVTREFAD